MLGYPHFLFYIRIEYELKMWFHNRLRHTVVFDVIILSSKVKKDDFYLFSKKLWHFLNFICAYLSISWPIFSQIEVCYSWNNTLSVLWILFFILMTSSWSKIRLKGISPNFAIIRIMSMGVFFPEIMSLHFLVLCAVSCLLLGRFLWNFDML